MRSNSLKRCHHHRRYQRIAHQPGSEISIFQKGKPDQWLCRASLGEDETGGYQGCGEQQSTVHDPKLTEGGSQCQGISGEGQGKQDQPSLAQETSVKSRVRWTSAWRPLAISTLRTSRPSIRSPALVSVDAKPSSPDT